MSAGEVAQLKDIIEKECKIEGELKRNIMLNVKRLKDVGSWRGLRSIARRIGIVPSWPVPVARLRPSKF